MNKTIWIIGIVVVLIIGGAAFAAWYTGSHTETVGEMMHEASSSDEMMHDDMASSSDHLMATTSMMHDEATGTMMAH